MMRIIDTHAHYDDEQFDTDRAALLQSLPGLGIERVVNVGASLRGAKESVELAKTYPHVYAAVGIHPDHVDCLNEDVLADLAKMCADPRVVAVGEIGLDYYWDNQPRDVQKHWFIRQLEMAKMLGLPVNIHSREAAQDTFDIMKQVHAGSTGGVIHCYSGSAQMAAEYVKMGYMLGIGGVVTFKNARVLKEVVEQVPLTSLVTETDSPYLAPTPHRGKRNASVYIPLVIEQIAQIKDMDPEETADILYENALRVYRWPEQTDKKTE